MKNNHTFSFGPFTLDNTERLLLYGESPIPLQPRPFDLLLYFVQHPNRLIEREDILQEVWGSKHVHERNLHRTVSELRKKIGDDAQKYIQTTTHNNSYRFNAEVFETQPGIPDEKQPWVGLRAFKLSEAQYFHGRDNEVSEMLAMLEKHNFLAVVGASGTGKSSLVRAGLIPAFQNKQSHHGFRLRTLLFRPGASPLIRLAEQVLKTEDQPTNVKEIEQLVEKMRISSNALVEALSYNQNDNEYLPTLIVVDQFEEFFIRCESADEQRNFIDCLLAAVFVKERQIFLVLTVRTDFYSKLESHKGLWNQITRHQYGVRHLSRDQLREVITKPASVVGLEVEEAFIEEILNDLGESAGALPLLSHAMFELFELREGRRLTFEAYRLHGRVKETIANHANAVFEKFNQDEKSIATRILLKLVKVGEEPEHDVRQQVPIHKLVDSPEQLRVVENVVKKLSDKRLLTTWVMESPVPSNAQLPSQITVVELAHEALIQHWPKLSGWLKKKRRARRLYVGLDISTRDWEESKRDQGFLYRGYQLANTLDARAEYEEFLGLHHREFLDASIRLEESERYKKEQEKQREGARQKLRKRLIAFIVITVVLTSLVSITFWKWFEARQQRDVATANSLALASISQLSFDPERSLLLALTAGQLASTAETTKSLRQALAASYIQDTLPAHQMQVLSVSISSDSRYLLTGGADEARLWDLTNRKLVRTLKGHADWLTWAALNPDGNLAVTASRDHTARVWNLLSGELITELRGHTKEVNQAIFSPDGAKILTSGEDNTARIWDTKTGKLLNTLTGHQKWLNTAAYSLDGKLLATASGDKTARVWDAQTGKHLGTLIGHNGTVISVAFSPNGKQIITGSSDKTARIWEAGTWKEVMQLQGHLSSVTSTEFSHDGKWILTASKDSTARLWNSEHGFLIMDFRGHFGVVNTAIFSPDDTHVYTASGDQTSRIWEVRLLPVAADLVGHKDKVSQVVFSPDGKRIVTASSDRTAILWDVKTESVLKVFLHPDAVNGAVFSPDGKQIATASSDAKIRLWDVETGTMLKEFIGHTGSVNTVTFGPDGSKIVTASNDQTVKAWDVSSGRRIPQFVEYKDKVNYASFSPNGRIVATASADNVIRGWDAEFSKKEFEWNVWNIGSGTIKSVKFSIDGKYLVASCGDQTVRVWNLVNRELIAVLRGRDKGFNYAEFNPSGEMVIAAGIDQTTQLWDLATGKMLFQLPNATDSDVTYASFSPDGMLIATANSKGNVAVYRCEMCSTSQQYLLALAHRYKTRELTAAERTRYLIR